MNELIALHVAALRARGFSKRTIGEGRDLLVRMNDALALGLAVTSRPEIEKFLGNEAWSEATRETYHGHAARFYAWATEPDVDLLDHDPMATMKRPHARRGSPRPLARPRRPQAQPRPAPGRVLRPQDTVVVVHHRGAVESQPAEGAVTMDAVELVAREAGAYESAMTYLAERVDEERLTDAEFRALVRRELAAGRRRIDELRSEAAR